MKKLKLGVAGLGRAFSVMLPTLVRHPRVELIAAADPRAEARARFVSDFGGRTYETVDALCDDAAVEAIYVASPHQYHAEHVRRAASKRKHVLVEKPMALSVADCVEMIATARAANIQMVVGHSHSFDGPIRRTRAILDSGVVGRVRMISALNFTDFLYRPRRPEELRTESGGGVVYNQAAHQIDVVRLLGGGQVKSVRAATGSWDPARPTEGAYSALLTFEDGVYATVVYSGYARFDSDEFCGWIGEQGQPKERARHAKARKTLQLAATPGDETALKNSRNYGGSDYVGQADFAAPAMHQHFGLVLVCCERADLRPLPTGVMIYGDSGEQLDALPAPEVPRSEVIDELYDAVVTGRPPLHDGTWALATLEACLAILQSARDQREVQLVHQVGLPNWGGTTANQRS